MVSDSVMVKDSSRGMGLECIRQYTARDRHAYASCRRSAEADTLQIKMMSCLTISSPPVKDSVFLVRSRRKRTQQKTA
jgi:hypothetical protein